MHACMHAMLVLTTIFAASAASEMLHIRSKYWRLPKYPKHSFEHHPTILLSEQRVRCDESFFATLDDNSPVPPGSLSTKDVHNNEEHNELIGFIADASP